MFDKAFSSSTMDYELIFWGYTFAIKKITWFAQVRTGLMGLEECWFLIFDKLITGYRRVFNLYN